MVTEADKMADRLEKGNERGKLKSKRLTKPRGLEGTDGAGPGGERGCGRQGVEVLFETYHVGGKVFAWSGGRVIIWR